MSNANIPFEAVRHLLEYLDDAEEHENFEDQWEAFKEDPVNNRDPNTNHIYLDMCEVRKWLDHLGENKPSQRLEQYITACEAQIAKMEAKAQEREQQRH